MNKFFLYNYLQKLTIDDVRRFALNNDISLSDKEAIDIYNYIKNNYIKYSNGIINIDDIIKDASLILSHDNYNKAYNIYLKYKENN